MNLSNPVNYVLVDFENVCEIDTTILANKNVRLVLLVGATRKTLDLPLVEALLSHSSSVQLVRFTNGGKNALDFGLAYYLGCSTAADPSGIFRIVSKDKGFEPLIKHLRSNNVRVFRHDDFASLSFSTVPKPPAQQSSSRLKASGTMCKPASESPPIETWSAQMLAHLRKTPSSRPKTRDKLVSYLVTHLGNGASKEDADSVLENLCQCGQVDIDPEGATTYFLDK